MKRTLLAFGSVALALCSGLALGTSAVTAAWAKGDHPYAGLDTLARALTTIEAHYVEEVHADELSEAAVRGMAHSLDPHSIYLDADELRSLQDRTEGRYHGIGVEIRAHDLGVRIARVTPGGPAALGGVQADDIVVGIDGEELAGWSLEAVGDRLRGERGVAVQLDLLRGGERISLQLVRDQVIAPTATGELFEPGWGYVRIEHFRHRTAPELAQELDRLAQEGGRPLQGLVLDLRDNPGGLLEEAVGVVDLFVGDTMVVETRTRGGEPEERLDAHAQDGDLDLDLVVLIDGGSASASEIVAGALQDLERATLVGSPSYGKGSVQQVYEFEDGSALKLTVARYHLPSGRSFDRGAGLEPDVRVERASLVEQTLDRVRQALEHSDLEAAERREVLDEVAALADELDEAPPSEVPWEGSLQERMARDPQLAAAWQQLHPGD